MSAEEKVTDYLWIAREVALRLADAVPVADREDLEGQACLELLIVWKKYDRSRCPEFAPWARRKLRFLLLDYLRKVSPHSRVSLLKAAMGEIVLPRTVSIFTPVSLRDDAPQTVLETLELRDNGQVPVEDRDEVENLLARLPCYAAKAARLYFLEGLTMKLVARQLNISESRVSQILTAAKRKLRELFAARRAA